MDENKPHIIKATISSTSDYGFMAGMSADAEDRQYAEQNSEAKHDIAAMLDELSSGKQITIDVGSVHEKVYIEGGAQAIMKVAGQCPFIRNKGVAYPLETSKIQCNKQEHRCTEAQAYVSGNLLETELTTYDVQSWTSDSIVFRNDLMCATEVYTIDLNTEAVTGAGHPANQDTPYCKLYPSKENRWTYQLSDGFKIYWAERQKARPFLLRIIQSLFGH